MNNKKIQDVINFLYERSMAIGIAESITGGELTSQLIRCEKNFLKVFKGSVIAYSVEAQETLLRISPIITTTYGRISRESSIEMALSVRKLLEVELAIGVAGNLGPDIIEGKDVGIVYFTVIFKDQVSNYSLNIQVQAGNVNTNKEIVNSQIIDEVHKILFES